MNGLTQKKFTESNKWECYPRDQKQGHPLTWKIPEGRTMSQEGRKSRIKNLMETNGIADRDSTDSRYIGSQKTGNSDQLAAKCPGMECMGKSEKELEVEEGWRLGRKDRSPL